MSARTIDSILEILSVTVTNGRLTVSIPLDSKMIDSAAIEAMAVHIDSRLILSKKPYATYSKLLDSLESQRKQLAEFYGRLFDAYHRATDTAPKVRRSSKDIAMVEMLSVMPDKMLKDFARITLGDDVDEYIFPDDRETLYDAYIVAQKSKE